MRDSRSGSARERARATPLRGLCALAGPVIVRKTEFRSDLILVVVVPVLVTLLFFTNPLRSANRKAKVLKGLLGLAIYSQALLVPYPFQERLSNVVPDVLIQ